MATITTVGYGDVVPVITGGRDIGFVLMLGGIAFFSGLTANLASLLVRGGDPRSKEVTAKSCSFFLRFAIVAIISGQVS